MDKKQLRSAVRLQKQAMTKAEIEEKSQKLAQAFFATEHYQQAKTIYGYLPYNQEVRTVPILEQAIRDGKRVAVPRICGTEMWFFYMDDFSLAEEGYRGIPEPPADAQKATDETALVLMPGVAFDLQGNRIGYGGGFYDRFLQLEPNHHTVALCYDFQVFPQLQTQEFDIPVDQVLWA